MALSIAIIVVLGIIAHQLFSRLRLPGFLGVLFLGMIIGPYGGDWIDDSILSVSADLRSIALIIILLRAGLGLHRQTLKMVGLPAIRLGFIPVLMEGFAILLFASWLLGISRIEAGMLGFIIAAVSPAVIVPKMLHYIETGRGTDKGIPTMILAGASLDDVVAITIFSAFAGWFAGNEINIAAGVLLIPLSVILGVLVGLVTAIILLFLFKKFSIRNTKKIMLIIAGGILLTSLESLVKHIFPIASLLGVMVVGFIIYEKRPALGKTLSVKFSKIWVFAEIMLFFLVGAEVNVLLAADVGLAGLLIIAVGLLARSAGVLLSLQNTNFTPREKGFCIIAYSPKATVQAAIASVPLALGAPAGEIILALAVVSVVITAPLGSIAINMMGNRFLKGKGIE